MMTISKDFHSYPILTEEVSSLATRRPGAPGTPLGQIVEGALHEILGWRPKTSDPRGFVAALTQSFTHVEEDDHEEWVWTPHTYTIQADLGAVTGAQASIYARAKAALDQSLPLLEGLEALLPDADPEDTQASRAIVESGLTELVNEMGRVGGPRVQRVDSFFETLLGPDAALTDDPEQVEGQLGLLRERFGLERSQVNTVEEEQILTDYLILVEHVISLQRSWETQIRFFDRKGDDVFLGTQLVLLSRALAVVTETVQEAYMVMDSVFLGAAERQTISLPLDGQPLLTIDELLGWVERFASEEAPRLIREAGKDGVIAFIPTLRRLHNLSYEVAQNSNNSNGNTRGFHTPRVQRVLKEIAIHLKKTLNLADPFVESKAPLLPSAPRVKDITFRDAKDMLFGHLISRNQEFVLHESLRIHSLRMAFNAPLDHDTMIARDAETSSLLVEALSGPLADKGYVPGVIKREDAQTIRFIVEEQALPPGKYHVTLFGDRDPSGKRPAIVGAEGVYLDGSGDGKPGGNFDFTFHVYSEKREKPKRNAAGKEKP
jgi:hypothetical protein